MPQQEPATEDKKEGQGQMVVYPDGTTEFAKDAQDAAEKMQKYRENR